MTTSFASALKKAPPGPAEEEFLRASDALFSRIADGRLVTGVHGEMSFDEIPKAHDMLESRQTTGSVIFKF